MEKKENKKREEILVINEKGLLNEVKEENEEKSYVNRMFEGKIEEVLMRDGEDEKKVLEEDEEMEEEVSKVLKEKCE